MSITYDAVSDVRRAAINVDESIQEFAYRVLGDATRWVEVVGLNDLLPPFVGYGDRLAAPGALLIIPGDIPYAEYQDVDADLVYERDLALVNGDLAVTDGDLRTVSGVANLKQALTIRIVTGTGELIYHPRYGCDVKKLLGASSGPLAAVAAGAYVESALRSDPRIQRIESLDVDVVGDSVQITGTVNPITGSPRKVDITI